MKRGGEGGSVEPGLETQAPFTLSYGRIFGLRGPRDHLVPEQFSSPTSSSLTDTDHLENYTEQDSEAMLGSVGKRMVIN